MEATQIYGLLLVAQSSPRRVAEELGVSRALVERVCRGERAGGRDALRVRHRIAEAVGLTEQALWGQKQEAA